MRVAWPSFEAAEALIHVAGKARLAILPVAEDIHPGLDLLVHDFPHGDLHAGGELLSVIGLAMFFRPHEIHKPGRTYQAADVGGENPVRTPLHSPPPDAML